MTVNFDILIAGCNTHCRHCYVGGGPGPMMKSDDALLFIEKLDALAELLPFEASLTLDNEPMNHTVHQNGDLFVGNTGVETERIGNLRTLDIKETAARIAALPGNRVYSAFYEADQLPGREMLMEAIA